LILPVPWFTATSSLLTASMDRFLVRFPFGPRIRGLPRLVFFDRNSYLREGFVVFLDLCLRAVFSASCPVVLEVGGVFHPSGGQHNVFLLL